MQGRANFKNGFNTIEYEVFEEDIKINPNCTIGKNSSIGNRSTIHNAILGGVNIGEGCIIGNFTIIEDDVAIGDGSFSCKTTCMVPRHPNSSFPPYSIVACKNITNPTITAIGDLGIDSMTPLELI